MAHKYLPSVKDKLLSWVISDLIFYLIHMNIMYLADVVNLRKLLYRNKIQAKPKNKSFIIFSFIIAKLTQLFCVKVNK